MRERKGARVVQGYTVTLVIYYQWVGRMGRSC